MAMKTGHVVEEFTLPNGAQVVICDDSCRDKTPEDTREILDDIARFAYPILKKTYGNKQKEEGTA